MKRIMSLLFLTFACNCLAASLNVSDKEKIESTIRLMLDSLQNGDTEVAFSMNTADTRETFGTAGNFLAMVKENYRPLLRHEAATVIDMTDVSNGIATTVMIVDKFGAQWMAIFMMKPHSQLWQIESCILNPAAALKDNAI